MKSRRPRIVVVDDDRDLLRLMAMRLGAAGYEVVTAPDGESALVSIGVERPGVVVTDLRMDGMDGLALFDAIHERHPSLPVIILTAFGTIPEAVDATRRGVFGFLTKPFDGSQLVAQVALALRTGDGGDGASGDAWRREIVTRSPVMEEMLEQAKRVAETDTSVQIRGPSGTGKDLLARAIHEASPRREHEMVAVNCAAIPESLLESELFGHVRGAFTGALRDQPGLFRTAHRGTVFLDEVADLPAAVQGRLLRVLQNGEVRPLGSSAVHRVDVRIVSATHRVLEDEVAAGRFREDLYYRLNVVVLEVPPLERRREDIPLLAAHRLRQLAGSGRRRVTGFSPEAMDLLSGARWPGNVRQLFNVVEQAHALSATSLVSAGLVRRALRDPLPGRASLQSERERFERDYLVRLLRLTDGNVSRAARMAGRNRTDFHKLLRRHGVERAAFVGAVERGSG